MIERLALFVSALTLASACAESKGPPPRVAEVPIDEGGPPRGIAPPPPPSPKESAGPNGMPEFGGDPSAAFGLGAGGAGGVAALLGGGGAGAAALLGGAGAGGGGGPTPVPTMRDVPGASGRGGGGAGDGVADKPSVKPLPPKAERLTATDCNKIMDKYIELVGISQGISPDAISGVMSMLRNSVANDPNYSNALGACAKENTKTQYRCAMKAADVDAWKACLQ